MALYYNDDSYEEVIGIHVDFEYLKVSDLRWLFRIVGQAEKEIIFKKEETSGKKISPPSMLIDSIYTGNSIDLRIALDSIYGAMTTVTFIKEIFNKLKNGSDEKRYVVGYRNHLNGVIVKRERRKKTTRLIHEKYAYESVEEFELEYLER